MLRVAGWTALGLALIALAQWTADGAPRLPWTLPSWAVLALPYFALLIFGLFLAATFGGAPGAGLGLAGALAGLLVAGLPVLYALGLAQRYGLPANAGLFGQLLSGSWARAAGATWAGVCLVQTWRRPARRSVGLPQAEEPLEIWRSPVTGTEDPGPVVYIPAGSERS